MQNRPPSLSAECMLPCSSLMAAAKKTRAKEMRTGGKEGRQTRRARAQRRQRLHAMHFNFKDSVGQPNTLTLSFEVKLALAARESQI